MTRIKRLADNLWQDTSGVYAIEFALITPVFLLLMTGAIEFGLQSYVRAVANGQMDVLARSITLAGANTSTLEASFTTRVRQIAPSATVSITKVMMKKFIGLTTQERLTTDIGSNGYIAGTGDCYEDINGNNIHDMIATRSGTIGGGEDIVRYSATITYPRFMPVSVFLPSVGQNATVVTNTMVRREAFENQAPPVIVCN